MVKRTISYCFIFLFLFQGAFGQSKTDSEFYNAFSLSKKLIELEKQISEGKNILTINPAESQRLLGYLVWYADLQDNNKSEQVPLLNNAVSNYSALGNVYHKIYGAVADINKFFSITASQFKSEYSIKFKPKSAAEKEISNKYAAIENYTGKINTLNKTLPLLRDSLNLYTDSIKTYKDSIELIDARFKLILPSEIDSADYKTDSARADALYRKFIGLKSRTSKLFENANLQLINNQKALDGTKNSLLNFANNSKDPDVIQFVQSVNNLKSDATIKTQELNTETERTISNQLNYREAVLSDAAQNSVQFKLPSQSDIIDAIAIYLAKRVKQEAIMWFFETIQKNAAQYELIQTFFPNTITLLQSNEVYDIPNLGSQWRYALSKDFVKMPRNVIESKWFEKWFDKEFGDNRLIYEYLRAGFNLADLLVQRYSYRNMVKQLYLQQNNRSRQGLEDKNLMPKDIFSLLYAFNQECFIASGHDSTRFRVLQFEDFRAMNKDEIEIMLSLMDMKYGGSIKRFWKIGTEKFSLELKDINSVRQWLGGIESGIRQFEKIQTDFNKTQQEIKDGKKEEAVYSLFNLWENVNSLFNIIVPDTAHRPGWMQGVTDASEKVKSFTQMGFEVYNQITLKNYAGAVNTTIKILEDLLYYNQDKYTISYNRYLENLVLHKKKKDTTLNFVPEIAYNLSSLEKNKNITITQTSFEAAILFDKDRHAIQLIRRLAGFLNDVMLTTDSKQLSKVVESYALPPGSYKRKRNSWWSVDLNAFVGAYAGYEVARKQLDPNTSSREIKGGVYGITAPIGLSVSKTFGHRLHGDSISDGLIRNPERIKFGKKKIMLRSNSTFTLTVSVIDIGAVVSYRFNNTIDSVLPQEVRWSQVFSPGVHLAYGIPNTPIVFSMGYQYTPQLRKIEESNDPQNRQYNANRLYAGFLFDLPLANVFQRSFIRPKLTEKKK